MENTTYSVRLGRDGADKFTKNENLQSTLVEGEYRELGQWANDKISFYEAWQCTDFSDTFEEGKTYKITCLVKGDTPSTEPTIKVAAYANDSSTEDGVFAVTPFEIITFERM